MPWLLRSFYRKVHNYPTGKEFSDHFCLTDTKIAYRGFIKGFKSKIEILRTNSVYPTIL